MKPEVIWSFQASILDNYCWLNLLITTWEHTAHSSDLPSVGRTALANLCLNLEQENKKDTDLDTIHLLGLTKSLQQTVETSGMFFFSQGGRESSFNMEVSQPGLDF